MGSNSKDVKTAEKLVIFFTCVSGIELIGLQVGLIGWMLLAGSMLMLVTCSKQFRQLVFPLQLSLAILGLTAISNSVSLEHMIWMGTALMVAVLIPYLVSYHFLGEKGPHFRWHHRYLWSKCALAWIAFSGLMAYLIFPWYFTVTGIHQQWTQVIHADDALKLLIGIAGVGIWEELFFINTTLGIFRRFLTFRWANLAQATLYTSFLYEIGFRDIGPFLIFPFALLQGYVFKRTGSLAYVIAIHLIVDLGLFLALLHAQHLDWAQIF